MTDAYVNPPITEAICEFRISLNTPWDLTVPGVYYERVKDELPVREQKRVRSVEVKMAEEGLREELLINERMHYFTADRNIGIQVGPHLLAVNMLRPYSSWNRFRPRIEHAFRVLRDIVDVQELDGLGLHYINVIEMPEGPPDLREYLSLIPPFGEILPARPESLIVGCEIPFAEGRDACRIEITDALSERKDGTAFLLDIEYYLSSPHTIPANDAVGWLEPAHDQVVHIFEACLREPARELFSGKQPV
ncbi:MAG: TIGR04255 family protein [Methanomicrobiales archaeon]|nr:TIGR04255 family protein [Methanomicrobiales archaeon]